MSWVVDNPVSIPRFGSVPTPKGMFLVLTEQGIPVRVIRDATLSVGFLDSFVYDRVLGVRHQFEASFDWRSGIFTTDHVEVSLQISVLIETMANDDSILLVAANSDEILQSIGGCLFEVYRATIAKYAFDELQDRSRQIDTDATEATRAELPIRRIPARLPRMSIRALNTHQEGIASRQRVEFQESRAQLDRDRQRRQALADAEMEASRSRVASDAEQAKTRSILANEEARREFERKQRILDLEAQAQFEAMVRKINADSVVKEAELKAKYGRSALSDASYERLFLAEIAANSSAARERERLLKDFLATLRAAGVYETQGLLRGLSAVSVHHLHANVASGDRQAATRPDTDFLNDVILDPKISNEDKIAILKERISNLDGLA